MHAITKCLDKFKRIINTRVESFGPQYLAFGIFGVINYPFFYLIWEYLALQSYENFIMRLIATLLCIPLVLHAYWPTVLRSYLPMYWYLTLLFCFPYFFTFMLFKNHLSDVWLMSTTIVMVLLMLLVDWVSFIVLLLLGVILATITYKLTTHEPITQNNYIGLLAQYLGSLGVVLIFARNREKISEIKFGTLRSVSASMAHELRTPLRSISTGIMGVKNMLSGLFTSEDPKVVSDLKSLTPLLDVMESETNAAFTVIDMLLIKADLSSISANKFKQISIEKCVELAITRYAFKRGERDLVHIQPFDFEFYGDETLMVHVLFNLFKNSIYYIKAKGSGDIHIWHTVQKGYNVLHFKDTGTGIDESILPRVFDKFFTRTPHGTGVGLAFCKMVMQSFGGDIECQSSLGEYTEFILSFPQDFTGEKTK